MNNSKKKLLLPIFIFGLFILSIIIFYLVDFASKNGKAKTIIQYAPFIAEVQINGNIVNNNSETYLSPGQYSVYVNLDGFNSIEDSFTISSTEDAYFYGLLQPNSEHGEYLQEEYKNDYIAVESTASFVATLTGIKEKKEKPILNHLPYKNSLFSIGNTYDENDNFTITIRSSKTYLDSAITKLKEFDSIDNLSRYNIQIIDFENPLFTFINNSQTDPQKFLEKGFNTDTVAEGYYFDDNYYYTTITSGSEETYSLITHKIILEKSGESWSIIGKPYPILTIYNTAKNLPIELLVKANNL